MSLAKYMKVHHPFCLLKKYSEFEQKVINCFFLVFISKMNETNFCIAFVAAHFQFPLPSSRLRVIRRNEGQQLQKNSGAT